MSAEERYANPPDYPVGRLVRKIDEPIRVGSMLWVLTDPHEGHELAYNRWYERDHYYGGCMIGPYHFAGRRWVAPRRYRDVRLREGEGMPFPLDAGSYAVLYWYLDEHYEDALDWATPQVHALYAADRGFASRTHYNTGTYEYRWRAHRDAQPVPLELALDHHYDGMVAWFIDPADGVASDELDAWFDEYLPSWMPNSQVATVSAWTAIPLEDTGPVPIPKDPNVERRQLHIHFVEGDPLESWDHERRLASDLQASGLAAVRLAAPFIPTVIGTDRYVDELW